MGLSSSQGLLGIMEILFLYLGKALVASNGYPKICTCYWMQNQEGPFRSLQPERGIRIWWQTLLLPLLHLLSPILLSGHLPLLSTNVPPVLSTIGFGCEAASKSQWAIPPSLVLQLKITILLPSTASRRREWTNWLLSTAKALYLAALKL